MKTLIFCTGYAANIQDWDTKYGRWIEAISKSSIVFDKVLIPDDGSPVLPPSDKNLSIIDPLALPQEEPTTQVVIAHYQDNLGRQGVYVYPGWYRSFMFSCIYAKQYNYNKIIHIESDAFILSSRMKQHINQFSEGWETYWCPKYQTPETAIQVIAGSSVEVFCTISNEPYSKFSGIPADPNNSQGSSYLPYSVNKNFVGDRYGENASPVPDSSDYACQIGAGYSDYTWINKDV
jgi:hypothetical protein